MVGVKICGIAHVEDLALVGEAGADYAGFVFAESPRRVEPEHVAAWRETLEARGRAASRRPLFVGVFVNATVADLARAARTAALDLLQLHGDETPAFCAEAGRIAPVIKTLRLSGPGSLGALDDYAACHALLIEPYHPDKRGGAGVPLALDLARRAVRDRRVFLAGGLTPETVGEAVRVAKPMAVDVSSGVESAPGHKDRDRVTRFVAAARAASSAA